MRNLKTKSVKVTGGIFLVLFLVISSGNMFGQEKGLEMSVTGYGFGMYDFIFYPGAMFSIGHTLSKGIRVEYGIFIGENWLFMLTGDIIISPFPSFPIEPYLLLGMGAVSNFSEKKGGFLPDVGAGVKLHLTKRFAIRTEYHIIFLKAGISYYF